MTHVFRQILFLLLFLGVVSVERTLGLPFISLVLASNFLAPSGRISKSTGILITGIFISISYLIPIWLAVGIIASLVFILEHRLILLHRESLTYFASVILAALIIGIASHYSLSLGSMVYHFVLAVVCLFLIRFWLMKKNDKWNTR
ncbi:hypothetical protein BH10PAT2_BH10PAT2_1000 [soil metagenome]